MSYIKQLNEVLDSPCYSYKLKDALRAFDKMDCVDALHDSEVLVSLCKLRIDEVRNQSAELLSLFNREVA